MLPLFPCLPLPLHSFFARRAHQNRRTGRWGSSANLLTIWIDFANSENTLRPTSRSFWAQQREPAVKFQRVVVTGGSGRLGRSVVERLARHCDVTVLDIAPSPS